MTHDLTLARKHALSLALTLMVPVTLFQVDDEYGVLPSEEIDERDALFIVHAYDPWEITATSR